MRETAGAKVNLCLEVTGRLPDGYHGVRTVLQSLEFGDMVELERLVMENSTSSLDLVKVI